MIVNEKISESLIRYYSDKGFKIRQLETGKTYDEAIDIIPCIYNYEETEQKMEEIY